MRARDLAGLPPPPGAAEEEPGVAGEEAGAGEDAATGTGVAACICSELWRRCAIVNTSHRQPAEYGLLRTPNRVNVVGYPARRHPLASVEGAPAPRKHTDSLMRNPLLAIQIEGMPHRL